jgi:hypothetical protein
MATKRRPIKLGVRFEIFKRDNFACQYCGKKPPEALLEIDHIVAVANGGSDDEHNLVTSCFECNRGKAARPLGQVAPSITCDRAAEVEERALQAEAYAEAVLAKQAAIAKQLDMVAEHWCASFDGERTETGWRVPRGCVFPSERSLRIILRKLPLEQVLEAVDVTAARNPSGPDKYFYAVCWRLIRGEEL